MPTTPVQGLPYPSLSDPANGPVALQNLATALEDYKTIVRCTSSTRPAHVEGRTIYETDTDRIQVSDGAAWVAFDTKWQTWNPGTNWTVGSKGGRWKLCGRTAYVNAWFNLGSFTIPGGSSSLNVTGLPLAPSGDPMYGNAFAVLDAMWNIPGANAYKGFGYVGSSALYVGTINNLNGYFAPITTSVLPLNSSTILNVNAIYQVA